MDDDELALTLLELGLDLPLREMVMARGDLIFELRSQRNHVVEHVIKLVIAPKSDAINHWRGELLGALKKISAYRLKKSFKPLPVEGYFEYLWGGVYEDTENGRYLLQVKLREVAAVEKIRETPEVEVVYTKLQAFFREFSTLCASGIIGEDAQVKLRKLVYTLTDH